MGFDPGARGMADQIKSNFIDFDTAYIKDHKLVCNDSKINTSTTAKYAAVDIGAGNVPTQMICKCIFSKGTRSGTVALISQANGRSTINNITLKSLHIVFTANYVATQVWNNNSIVTIDTYYFSAPYFNPVPLDDTTEVLFQWSISGDTITLKATSNGVTTTRNVTYTGLSGFLGRYCTLEHWYDAPFSNVGKPQFTYFEVNGTGFEPVKDDFKRSDGPIGVAKSGHTYALMTESPSAQ